MKLRILACLVVAVLVPVSARAQKLDMARSIDRAVAASVSNVNLQSAQAGRGDPLWNGIAIGAGVGALVGMVLAPPAFCGRNDGECAAIVRVAIGLPAIGAGIGVGALVDGLMKTRSPAQPFAGAPSARISLRF